MKSSKLYSTIKDHIVTTFLMLSIMLIMVTPVLANTSNWAFIGTIPGRYLNGGDNGVYHTMTAGSLTNCSDPMNLDTEM